MKTGCTVPVKASAILSAVFAALGEDLDVGVWLLHVDVDLAVLAVHFLLAADAAGAHVEAVLDASTLEPYLPTDFGSKLWLDLLQHVTKSKRLCIAQLTKGTQGNLEVVLDAEDVRQTGVVGPVDKSIVKTRAAVLLKNQASEPRRFDRA
jgi:hypothetical protein